jgi:hypothetical protein
MRYYFDLRDGEEVAVDDEGVELSSLQAVQEEAALSLADMARNAIPAQLNDGAYHLMAIEVRDESGPVLRVRLTCEFDRRRLI